MSLSDRRSFLAGLALLPLGACGFSPVYAPGGAGMALRDQVATEAPKDDSDFQFVAAFEERLGRGASARFRLGYDIRLSQRGAAQVRGLGSSRITLFGTITYSLTELATGEVATSGSLRNFTNYSTTDNQLATRRAQEDARARLMRILADQVANRLIAAQVE